MKITDISIQTRNPDRVNVSVDGKYRFSLDITQVTDLGIKTGNDYSHQQLAELEQESSFGKLYARALEYTLMRPHSAKEIRDYLRRKTRATKYKSHRTGEMMERQGVSQTLVDRVYDRLVERGYIDDQAFAKFWIENRNQRKGSSLRKLQNELRQKGVESAAIDTALASSQRNDSEEIRKIIDKKRRKYPDDAKLTQYLMRQGFRYGDIQSALNDSTSA